MACGRVGEEGEWDVHNALVTATNATVSVCWQSTDSHPVANPTTWSRSEKVSPSPNKREVSFAYKIQGSHKSRNHGKVMEF